MIRTGNRQKMSYEFGILNPVSRPTIRRRAVDNNRTILGTMKEAADQLDVFNVLSNIGPLRGVVLRVEPIVPVALVNDYVRRILSSVGEVPPAYVRIKVRIPELHMALPTPRRLANSAFPDHAVIDMYPTFVAESNQTVEPAVGSVVYVDFGNRTNMTQPVYLGPLNYDNSANSGMSAPPSASGNFNGGTNVVQANSDYRGRIDTPLIEDGSNNIRNAGIRAINARRREPKFIVVHSTEFYGTKEGLVRTFLRLGRDPESAVSTHFLITRSGEILYFVPWRNYVCWHVAGWNTHSIGLDLEARVGGSGDTDRGRNLPIPQLTSLRRLINCVEFAKFPVVGHGCHLRAGKSDPGHNFDWQTNIGLDRTVSEPMVRASRRQRTMQEIDEIYSRLQTRSGEGHLRELVQDYTSEFVGMQ